MKRVTKAVGSFMAVGIAIAAMTTSSPSQAGDEGLVNVSCSSGAVTVTAVDGAKWHVNTEAPWKWDKGSKTSIDDKAAKFKGDKCEGTVTAFICTNDKSQCKGPIKVPVK